MSRLRNQTEASIIQAAFQGYLNLLAVVHISYPPPPLPPTGPLPVSVPGAVKGWCDVHDRFGSLPFATLLQPAIDYALDGFPVTDVSGAATIMAEPHLAF